MQITPEDLEMLVRETWAPTLALAVDAPVRPPSAADLRAQVALSGAWSGTVTVEATRLAVAYVAARMFDLPVADLADDDLVDAVAEIANVLGGNVKPFAGGECDMSLPRSGEAVVAPGERVASVGFAVEGHPAHLVVATG